MDLNFLNKYIPKKYRTYINDVYKDIDGYWIELKPSYISTTTECSTIHELTIKDLKNELKSIKLA
ncbi:MAG: hypothetical protein E7J02_12160 [Staphylococcus warneri]|nr:hypothetical protein [Staphylococcus warneri]MDU4503733.1 hypothetical protein [Staphylococcus warneri]